MQDKSYTHVVKKGGRVFYKYNVETLKRILAYDRISQQIDWINHQTSLAAGRARPHCLKSSKSHQPDE